MPVGTVVENLRYVECWLIQRGRQTRLNSKKDSVYYDVVAAWAAGTS